MQIKKIPQSKLPPNKLKDLRWGSHVPANSSILKTFPITGVLELGAGLNSTPLFFNNCKKVISIENDQDWINKLKNENLIIETDDHKIIHHEISKKIVRGTHRKDIPKNILDETLSFYKSFMTDDLNFLFVDGYAGFRLETLIQLHEFFDIVAYHDAEPKYDYAYDYSLFTPSSKYVQLFDRTFSADVGILISNKFENLIPTFKQNYELAAEEYSNRFNADYKIILENTTGN